MLIIIKALATNHHGNHDYIWVQQKTLAFYIISRRTGSTFLYAKFTSISFTVPLTVDFANERTLFWNPIVWVWLKSGAHQGDVCSYSACAYLFCQVPSTSSRSRQILNLVTNLQHHEVQIPWKKAHHKTVIVNGGQANTIPSMWVITTSDSCSFKCHVPMSVFSYTYVIDHSLRHALPIYTIALLLCTPCERTLPTHAFHRQKAQAKNKNKK